MDTPAIMPLTNIFAAIPVWRAPRIGFKCGNTCSQATKRRKVRRRSNLPRTMQKRLGFKCR